MALTLEQARAWYDGLDPIHDFSHIERVYRLAERIGRAEGADMKITLAAVLLHDSRGSQSGAESRANHHVLSAAFAEEVLSAEGWHAEDIAAVKHCVLAHRFRRGRDSEEPRTLEAKVLFDADKLEDLGAIGVARTIGYSAMVGQPIFVEPSQRFLHQGELAPGEVYSAYHEYFYKLVKIKDLMYTACGKAIAEERFAYLKAYFEVLSDEVRGLR